MTSVVVVIEGFSLPGRRCGPTPEGRMCENVHVGLWHRTGPVQLVAGDAASARWELEIVVREAGPPRVTWSLDHERFEDDESG